MHSYFTVIALMWSSQTNYDVPYEANDFINRVFKVVHIILFIFISSASGGWKLDAIMKDDGRLPPREHTEFSRSRRERLC